MERPDHLRFLPLPLADRSLLQTTQADPPTGGLSGQQRERGQMAVMDRSALDAASALLGLSFQMEPQFHQALHTHSLGPVVEKRFAGNAGKPWDSRSSHALSGPA